MTNSIASAKCPSILTSGKYGMSQRHSIIDDSKEYIFVKLTDSAFRAIEEYQRNSQAKRLQKGQSATIQFIGNAGVIQFPPTSDGATSNGGSSDGRKFGFAIDDVEGSLECIQQSGNDLDVLGSLNYRMRIHANDDVYDTTRTKMAIAEETEKSKCIREIKPNQTDIGRKVKRPVSAASIHAYSNGTTAMSLLNGVPNGNGISGGGSSSTNSINGGSSSYLSSSNNNHISSSSNNNNNSRNKLSSSSLNQHSPPGGGVSGGGCSNGSRLLPNASSLRSSPNPSLTGGNGTVVGGANNSRYGSPLNFSSSNLPTLSSNVLNGNYSPPGSGNNHMSGAVNPQQKKNIGSGGNSRGNSAAVGKGNGKVNGVSNGKSLDVSRRKIRERLIHLLALKPFKKPELYSRLQNEGLAQRERQLISTILKDISTLSRDNTYNLRRSMWNDVDENWPFFSEQEIQQLKRRKPQNLTPPTSSDAGSSISGQSPTSSNHTGSPPPIVSSNMNGVGGGTKRASLEPDAYEGALALSIQSKKQRISHYKKDGNQNGGGGTNVSAVGRIGLGIGSNNSGSSSYNQNHRSSSAAYSPHTHNTGNSNGNDENSANSDLTFSVLNNMDDFIQHATVVGGDSSLSNRSKTATGNNKFSPSFISGGNTCSSNNNNSSNHSNSTMSSQTAAKEKRNSGGSTSSSGYGSNRESSTSSTSAMHRKVSPTPYANNFVPETKISSNANSSRLTKQQQGHRKQQQQSSPSYNNPNNHYSHNKSANNNNNISNCNGVIPNAHDDYSSTLAPPTSQTATTNYNGNSNSNRSRHHANSSGVINDRIVGEQSSSSRPHSRSLTPTQKGFNKHHGKNNVTTQELQYNNQQEEQQAFYDTPSSPQTASQESQQQDHSSPTQQIAAAASTFSLTNSSIPSGDAPRYDFSSYTPITSIEQRRKYKTEFESDFDEYRKLSKQIESVGRRFQELYTRLGNVQRGCSDYYTIKNKIVFEYNRIIKEEAINRDKLRFDYLHEKLAHIKQLVTEYDKKLTSGLAAPTISANQQQQQHEYLNQHHQTTVTSTSAHLSPMLQSSGESNHSPPLMSMNPNSATVVTNNNSLPSSSHSKKSLNHHQNNHQQQHQQQEHYKQHHEPETIQMVEENEESDVEEISLQYQHPYNSYDGNDSHINLQQYAPSSPINSKELQQQQHHRQTPSQLENHNNDSDSDSDSSSSSSSNDDDNSDDDNSDASDDDNSDDDSNDDQ